MAGNINIDIVPIILPLLTTWTVFAINFAKTRFLVLASEYGMNSKESAELMKIAEGIQCNISGEGSAVSLQLDHGNSPYLDIITNGMDAPLTGGEGGFARNPDGSVYRSNVPLNFQGHPIAAFAKEGEDVFGEIVTMLIDLFKDAVSDAISSSTEAIGETLAGQIAPMLGGT